MPRSYSDDLVINNVAVYDVLDAICKEAPICEEVSGKERGTRPLKMVWSKSCTYNSIQSQECYPDFYLG